MKFFFTFIFKCLKRNLFFILFIFVFIIIIKNMLQNLLNICVIKKNKTEYKIEAVIHSF